MAEKTVAAHREQTPASRERTRSQERFIAPPVDIYETPDGLFLMADLPGVGKDDLDIKVENNVLTIQGSTTHSAPGASIAREYELVGFFRQFELSDKVDQTKITAELKHGVLQLHLPKPEVAKPRKIAVTIN
jgi:HSP20 family molecular chaperone IbpA